MSGVREAGLACIALLALDVALVRHPFASTQASPGVTITYLANEGVLLSSGSTQVLIDALFLRYGPEYAIPADSTQSALERARAPFDSVDSSWSPTVTAITFTRTHWPRTSAPTRAPRCSRRSR